MSIRFILICYSNAWLASFYYYYYYNYCKNCYYCENERRRCVSLGGAPCSVEFCNNKIFALCKRAFFNSYLSKKKISRKNKFEFYELWTVGNIRILRKPVSKIESRRHCGNTCRCRGKGIKINTRWAIRPIQGNRVYFILEVITLKTPTTLLIIEVTPKRFELRLVAWLRFGTLRKSFLWS